MKRDGEAFVPHSMPLKIQDHGKMCMKCKIDAIVSDCKLKLMLISWIFIVGQSILVPGHPATGPLSYLYLRF